MNHTLRICMLGSFTIEINGHLISDRTTRSHKMWALLAYLIYHSEQKISQSEIFSTVWNDDEKTDNPANVLKVMLHRTRCLLNDLDGDLGKQWILSSKGDYHLNPEIPYTLDIIEFENEIKLGREKTNSDERLIHYQKAVSIYKGEFLEKFVGDSWIIPIASYYHGLYVEMLEEMLALYESMQQYSEIINLCQHVCSAEKYEESLYIYYMKALLAVEQYLPAAELYRNLREKLYEEFGVQPCEELQSLFRQARQGLHTDLLDISDIPRLMHADNDDQSMALYCEFDIFKQIYHFSSRGIERNGTVIHLILINITDINGEPLSKRSLTVGVKNLRNLFCDKLRRGDIVSMCSPSQFLILLPNANFENTHKVMQRLINSFYQQYPHTPIKLNHFIQPVMPAPEFNMDKSK
ncbi:MAG: hypothetical protein E7290_11860 [Lachnospiraceae bacterium]|nr:hypothetical protein [Lachnospiraceae bacterium]